MIENNNKYYKLSSKQIHKTNPELWEIVNDYISDDIIWKGKFFLYENKIQKIPLCHCGNPVKFVDMINGFKESCSRKCVYDSPSVKNKRRETNIKKYGVENASKSDISKQRTKETNLERYGVEYTSQAKEMQENSIKNNLEKYGVEHPMHLESIKNKIKVTNLERYGVENPMQSPDILEKARLTNIEKYGVEWVGQNQEVISKKKKTNLERYGTEEVLSNPETIQKGKRTNLEKYGYEHAMQNKDIIEKSRQTNLDRHGVDWVLQSEVVKKKIKETNLRIYGVENVSKSKIIQSKRALINFDKSSLLVNDERYTLISMVKQEYTMICNECDFEFNIQWQLRDARIKQDLVICTNCNPISYSSSMEEDSLYEYIRSVYNGEIIRRFRIDLEIDIYLPELKIGFEHNGIYWHSEFMKTKNYHYDKMVYFEEKDIRVYQFWEDDWLNKRDIIKSMVSNSIGLSNRIYARKCEVKTITDNAIVKSFLNDNHIQGFVGSKVKIGLYFNDELVSLMTFGAQRKALGHNSKENSWELIRFCNKINTSVIGGASRLFKNFINNNDFDEIHTFSLNTHSCGDLYKKLNFEFMGNTKVNYYWGKGVVRTHRFNFRKDILIKEGYDPNSTEVEIMHNRGFFRIFDAGSKRWLYTK